ncbi:MAG TPA: hypothetical protein EYP85_02845 [Armatimonadetes bacterium]|nr:hypothetical protein [Armatimonadota bacterium]
MGRYEWILVPMLIGGVVALVLSNSNCHRFGSRLMGMMHPRWEGAVGGFLVGAILGLVIGLLTVGGSKRWLTGLGVGSVTGGVIGYLEKENGDGPPWPLAIFLGVLIGFTLRLLVFGVEHGLLGKPPPINYLGD